VNLGERNSCRISYGTCLPYWAFPCALLTSFSLLPLLFLLFVKGVPLVPEVNRGVCMVT